mgnify:CR=1 FL=1
MNDLKDGKRKKLIGLDPAEYEHPLDRAALDKLESIPGVRSLVQQIWEKFLDRLLFFESTGSRIEVNLENYPDLYKLHLESCSILDVSDIPYTLSQGETFEKVDEWKFSVKIRVKWSDYKKGDIIFDSTLNEWGIYGDSLDISSDGIDNDGDGLIDSEDSDENGIPRDSAKLIAANKIAESILSKITSTW